MAERQDELFALIVNELTPTELMAAKLLASFVGDFLFGDGGADIPEEVAVEIIERLRRDGLVIREDATEALFGALHK